MVKNIDLNKTAVAGITIGSIVCIVSFICLIWILGHIYTSWSGPENVFKGGKKFSGDKNNLF